MPRIHLCFVWHMHQPFYKDLATGEYRLPWTRYHALKDYYGMVKLLQDFPKIHQTFNLVPSMVLQISEYSSGKAADPFLDCAVKPAEDLTEAERDFLLRHSFQANPTRMIARYPRYAEIYDAWQNAGADARRARQLFSPQDLRDLQVLSQLAWFDEEFLDHDQEVKALVAKQRGYSLPDQAFMARKQLEILRAVIPVYREFAARGQIEISTTPFYHPILPLICDSAIAAESHPGVALPSRFSYPGDARWQLQNARALIQREFGRAPVGLWPSEGSVSDQAFAIAAEAGFEWAASDNGVLGQTLRANAGPDVTYRSYLWKQQDRRIRLIFRDHFLSDLIGFVYSKMGAAEAAAHFLDGIRANVQPLPESGPVLVPIILDGENAWEYYDHNGRPFLCELYRRISESSDLAALTVSEALALDQPRPLDHIFPGSWINANFDIWIGAAEDNTAWEYLLRARQAYDQAAPSAAGEDRTLAHEELMIAEGSDWLWWYGPEHQSEDRPEFDQLYRTHLANAYRALKLAPPEELSRPILALPPPEPHQAPTNAIHPVIDGQVTSYFEWMGAGRYRTDNRSGAMQAQRPPVTGLYYGAGGGNLYLRLDFEGVLRFRNIELRTGATNLSLLDHPEVERAQGKILEICVPLRLLQSPGAFHFQLAWTTSDLPPEVIPPAGWIEFSPPPA